MSESPTLPSVATTSIALQFVAELQAGRRPSIEAALDSAPTSEWPGLLQSLLIAEINHRRSRGETPVAREYLPRFPAHQPVVRSVVPEELPVARAAMAPVAMPNANGKPVLSGVPMAIVLPRAFEDFERPPSPPPMRSRRRRRLRLLFAGGVVAIAIAGVVFYMTVWRGRKVEENNPTPAGGSTTIVAGGTSSGSSLFQPKPTTADANREVAQWLIGIGGRGTLAMDAGGQRPFGPDVPLPKAKFAVTSVTLPPESSDRWSGTDLARLRGCGKLAELHLHHPTALTDAAMEPLAALPLRTLDLQGVTVTVSRATIRGFADLQSLTLLDAPGIGDSDLEAIGKLAKLNSLSLNTGRISPKGLAELKGTQLRSLYLGEGLALSPEHVRVLHGLPLEEVESRRGMGDDAFLEFAVFPNLKRFRLQQTTITDAGLKVVLGLGMLEVLQITGSSITSAGLEYLEERKGLKVLDLTGAKLDDKAAAKLLGFPALREVRLAGCPISDQGVLFLTQIDNIQVLDLANTQITDTSISYLKKHPTLKNLVLTGTRVTAAAVAEFERETPNCRVVAIAKK